MTNTIPERKQWVAAREKAIRRMFSKEVVKDKMVEPRICKFTKEEDERINNEIRAAKIFMKTYGRGRKPRMIDTAKYNQVVVPPVAQTHQSDIHNIKFTRVTLENVDFVCATEFGVSVKDLHSDKRSHTIASARHMAIYVLCHNLGFRRGVAALTYARDRTTCHTSIQKISHMLRFRESETSKHYERIIKTLLEYERQTTR